MLDEQGRAVLSAVCVLCGAGGFKILDEQELGKLCSVKDNLADTLLYLAESGLVELRYAEAGTYCVCVTPKGRAYAEHEAYEKRASKRARRDIFFFAFCGALLGGMIASLFALLLSLVLP